MTVLVHVEGGALWAEVLECPGLFASGDTLAELADSLAEGVQLYNAV